MDKWVLRRSEMQTNDRQISELMKSIESGNAQLPDFQRGWKG